MARGEVAMSKTAIRNLIIIIAALGIWGLWSFFSEKDLPEAGPSPEVVCAANLREIQHAKEAWAEKLGLRTNAVPGELELGAFLSNEVMPTCPAGGKYSINAVGERPACSIASHNLR